MENEQVDLLNNWVSDADDDSPLVTATAVGIMDDPFKDIDSADVVTDRARSGSDVKPQDVHVEVFDDEKGYDIEDVDVFSTPPALDLPAITETAPPRLNAYTKTSLPKKILEPSHYQVAVAKEDTALKGHEYKKSANKPPLPSRVKPSVPLRDGVRAGSAPPLRATPQATSLLSLIPVASTKQVAPKNVAHLKTVKLPDEITIARIFKSMHHFCSDIVVKIAHSCIYFTVTENDRFPMEDLLAIELGCKLKDLTVVCKENKNATYTYSVALEKLHGSLKFKFETSRLSERPSVGNAALLANRMMADLRAAQPQTANNAVDEMAQALLNFTL